MKFYKGDVVRCLAENSKGSSYTKGVCYNIKKDAEDFVWTEYDNQGCPNNGWNGYNFEIISRAAKDRPAQDVEKLVQAANIGEAAVWELFQNHMSEYSDTLDKQVRSSDGLTRHGRRYSVVNKLAFEPFVLGNGYEVKIENGDLRVGCYHCDPPLALHALKTLRQFTTCQLPNHTALYAYRDGIGTTDRNGAQITWDDADRIQAALEKVLGV